ncbi:unnamed protein product [Ambrosiozyma monospora]|uniref:Unnamed protein product n=1 Tax=Ambrosiozyma monospora TaxID=43982 RepID=A0ACB5SQV1_AMBMO|nr:unnamed protein product [Ambrosiozyma monospora]
MSMFLNQQSLQTVDQTKLDFAEIQYDAMKATLNTIFAQCSQKCIPLDYGENDMNKGEATCTDRCVSKFMQANRLLGAFAHQVRLSESDLSHYEHIKRKYLSGN